MLQLYVEMIMSGSVINFRKVIQKDKNIQHYKYIEIIDIK